MEIVYENTRYTKWLEEIGFYKPLYKINSFLKSRIMSNTISRQKFLQYTATAGAAMLL